MSKKDLSDQVWAYLAAGEEAGLYFDSDGIVEEIGARYGYDLASIDEIPADEWSDILRRHDMVSYRATDGDITITLYDLKLYERCGYRFDDLDFRLSPRGRSVEDVYEGHRIRWYTLDEVIRYARDLMTAHPEYHIVVVEQRNGRGNGRTVVARLNR